MTEYIVIDVELTTVALQNIFQKFSGQEIQQNNHYNTHDFGLENTLNVIDCIGVIIIT